MSSTTVALLAAVVACGGALRGGRIGTAAGMDGGLVTGPAANERRARKLNSEVLLRPIYTEMLPGVAVHDSLFVLLRPGVAVPRRARAQNYPTQQNNQRIAPGTSSVQIGL